LDISIQFTPIRSQITTSLPDDLHLGLYELLSYKQEGYYFSPKFQNRTWDGVTRMYSLKTQSFRSGFLLKVADYLYSQGHSVSIIDYPPPLSFEQHSQNYKLRDYQKRLVNAIHLYRYGVIVAPPRSGKTLISASVFDSVRTFPSIFYCRSIDLAIQTKNRFKEYLGDLYSIGMVGDGNWELGDITICTIQSAYSAYNQKFEEKTNYKEQEVQNKEELKKLIENAKVIFFDEVHEIQGKSSRFILGKSKGPIIKIGLTATPEEGSEEDIRLEENIGPVIYKIGYSELIKEGFLLKPIIYMYKLPKLTLEGNYLQIYKKAVTENQFLNYLVKKLTTTLNNAGHSVVVQTEYRNHTEKLAKFLGVPYLMGNESGDKRAKILDELREKKIMCLVSTVIEQGIDVPSLNYSINLCGQKSQIATIQRMRSLTASEGKTVCGVIDFLHQCDYLRTHSNKRLKVYKSEPEFEVHIRDVSKKTIQDYINA